MNSREEILTRLNEKDREVTMPAPWQSRRDFVDLAERFTGALTAVLGEVRRADNLEEAWQIVGEIIEELNAKKVVVNGERPLTEFDLPQKWSQIDWHIAGKSEGNLRDFCTDADLGISGAEVALAETGSVVVTSGPKRSRLATLLPPVHLAIVPTSKLTTDLFTWTAVRPKQMPANHVFVSGPSKTGDIEQTMAVGVHGPKRFIVILYNDE